MSEYRLEMRGVTKTFPGVRALDQAELKLRPGTVHALMGENGAGKSTLMKCMFGIYKMDAGEIYLDGEKIVISDPLHALKRGVAMVHQELQPIPERSVAENIFLGRYPMRRILGIPFFAPGQGLFPRYTSGFYGGKMFVSRGISNSVELPRIFNKP